MTVHEITSDEHAKLEKMYRKSKRRSAENDIICCVPVAADGFTRDPAEVCRKLQIGYELLREICPGSPNPTAKLGGRIRVGYRHSDDEENNAEPQSGWDSPERRINVPWCRLMDAEDHPIHVVIDAQPEFCCSHELVHPFEEIFLDSNRNKIWKEAFCEALRYFVLLAIGLEEYALDFRKYVRAAEKAHNRCEMHEGAGLILDWLDARCGDSRDAANENIRERLEELITGAMGPGLIPGRTLHFGAGCRCNR